MFAGVGTFSIQIAKKNRLSTIFAIDLNPEAYSFLEKNVLSNKVGDSVIPILGDSRSIINKKMYGVADRVIMNLPEKSVEFVDVACKSLKSEGGIIHFYSFDEGSNAIERVKVKFREAVLNTGRRLREFSFARLVRPIAPHKWQVVVDALIS
jgi:tRNA G37 N-methylase Trm5